MEATSTQQIISIPGGLTELKLDCIVKVEQFGHNQYVNICNGGIVNVPWGAAQWFNFSVGIMAVVVFAGGLFQAYKLLFRKKS